MKRIPSIAFIISVLWFGQGCGENNTKAGNNGPETKKIRLAFVTNTKNDFWTTVRKGCNNAAENLHNVDVDFRFFTGSTAEEQNAILNDLVANRVDGIAVSPIDAEKQTEFLNQIAAKTLVVCVDSDAVNSKRASFIGSDNVASGKQAAELLKAALPKGGKVVLFVGFPNAQNARDRIQGLRDGLEGTDLQIVETMADATKTDTAQTNALAALAKYPDLAGMVGLYSYNGPAILKAVGSAGKIGQVKIVCFDDDTETLDGIASGGIYGSVVQLSTRIGYETVNRMDKYLSGDKSQLSQGTILFNSLPVTKGLVESVQAWHQDMLQP